MNTNTNMKDIVYEYLRTAILDCKILPGEYINEKHIAESLNTGRTPVREAILTLQNEGLIEIFPRKGMCAKAITIAETIELYQLRKILEPTIAVQFKQNIDHYQLMTFDSKFRELSKSDKKEEDVLFYQLDAQFHRFLIDSTRNSLLQNIFADIMQKTYRVGIFNTINSNFNSKRQTYAEHHRIIVALQTEDDNEINSALISHINQSRMVSLKTLELAGVPAR